MKVAIFCGGLGVRMGEQTQLIPKPMIRIGNRPILWHIMRYYASFGHQEFILCLGYKGESIKEYFLTHNEALTNDFVLDGTGPQARIELLSHEAEGWQITFADTGLNTKIGGRLKAVQRYIADDEVFLATYGDGLTDAPLDKMIASFHQRQKMAMFLAVRPQYTGHLVTATADGTVTSISETSGTDARMNAGFFVLKREILDLIQPDDELVEETFSRLIPEGEVLAYDYNGFFGPMDTIKDRQRLEALSESTSSAPWLSAPRRSPPASELPGVELMLQLSFSGAAEPLRRVLAVGCHGDDIEIGCGGTLLTLTRELPGLDVTWVVLSASGEREAEVRSSAAAFLAGAGSSTLELHSFRDGFFPYLGGEVKEVFKELGERLDPQLVFTHTRDDLHQDHRLAAELTWNTFRNQLVLEFEVPKFDGDLGRPNAFFPLSAEVAAEKVELLAHHFTSQASKHWFDEEIVPAGWMRLRGMEARAPERFAEAVHLPQAPAPAPA